ncbi:MAG: superoxide dismutase [Micavibrio sp.]|nr:superoxide dismutase [Micavibrio sp.]|tara:strand:- start:2144 stop:2674 length:531 start_codon:yes stop_codon:yes gene_type:complete
MRILFFTFFLIALCLSSAYAKEDMALATVINNKGETIGSVHIVQATKGVLLDVNINGLPTGTHGFHIHSVGDCSDHEHFKAAAGHIKGDGTAHGLMNPNGPEAGDLPNLIVGESGTVALELYAPDLVIYDRTGHAKNILMDDDGSAFMIHADPDDHMTQPIGGAGARIACGVIKEQ